MSEQLWNFNTLDWIDRYFKQRVRLDYDELQPILCFSLIWNLFETVACKYRADPTSIRKAVNHAVTLDQLKQTTYDNYVDYFRKRYLSNGNISDVFDGLFVSDAQHVEKAMVWGVLLDEKRDLEEIVYALLLIANRIRNNLFHGNKSIDKLPGQTELFRVVNQLLATFLLDIKPAIMPQLQRQSADD